MLNDPVEFVTAATTGFVPVKVYVIPAPFAGDVTLTEPVVTEHVGCVVEAEGALGVSPNLITTSSVEVQPLFVIVHLNVYEFPATPVKFEFAVVFKETLPPVPEIILHEPVPVEGVLAAKVVLVTPHNNWSDPALEVVGAVAFEKVITAKSAITNDWQLVVAFTANKL